MEGIRYIINDKGGKKAVVIDLDSYGHSMGGYSRHSYR
ncbi:MAG: hypothetical protein C5S38_02420 [Candidatus Methanophagaceae archaeon]|nr:MAG: hypothetical protein C5S38_02420 [Methanophagales archaeon]KAF5435996.1 hypothetical protein C5S36_01625 [Methanophagales archaeon]